MSLSLPLTAMEEFFFWEDRPAYPCSCFVRLRFSGRLDRRAFESAVRTMLARHPLLTAKVEIARRRRLRWVVIPDASPVIVWETSPVGGSLPSATRLDLQQEIGIRFHVRTDTVNSDLTIQFHHACCDGGGMAVFVRDLLVAYAMAYGPVPNRTRLTPLDAARLADRGRFGLTFGKLLKMLPDQLVGLSGARQFLLRRPAPVIPYRVCPNDSPLPENYPATVNRLLDPQATASLRKASLRLGVTTNDLLARDLFLALAEWQSRQDVDVDGQWMRMMIPMNLRTTEDRLLPAADVVSSVFLDRRKPDFADADRLLSGIHEQMSLIKRLQLGYTFVFSMAICRCLMGSLEKKVRADKCAVSCVFTNVGVPFAHVPLPQCDYRIVAGNVTVIDTDFVAPIHPYSCVTVAVGQYAHRLSITLHYDPRPLSAAQASDLLNTFVRRIRDSAGCGPSQSVSRNEPKRSRLPDQFVVPAGAWGEGGWPRESDYSGSLHAPLPPAPSPIDDFVVPG